MNPLRSGRKDGPSQIPSNCASARFAGRTPFPWSPMLSCPASRSAQGSSLLSSSLTCCCTRSPRRLFPRRRRPRFKQRRSCMIVRRQSHAHAGPKRHANGARAANDRHVRGTGSEPQRAQPPGADSHRHNVREATPANAGRRTQRSKHPAMLYARRGRCTDIRQLCKLSDRWESVNSRRAKLQLLLRFVCQTYWTNPCNG